MKSDNFVACFFMSRKTQGLGMGNYIFVLVFLWIRDKFWKYVLQSFKLVQNKTSKASSFHIPSCLSCVEKHISIVDMQEEIKKTSSPMKRKTSLGDCSNINSDDVQVFNIANIAFDVPPSSKWLPSCKRAN